MLRTVVLVCLVAFALAAKHAPKEVRELKGQKLVDHVNQQGKWIAEENKFSQMTLAEKKRFLGANKKLSPHMRRRGQPGKASKSAKSPDTFDAVKAWPQCSNIISQIQDQSACGSCWAVSTTSAMSDRLCIASNGKIQTQISALDLMACCADCGYQCQGGWPDEAWYKFSQDGIVTGSNYTDDALCKPYPIAPCHLENGKNKCPDEPDSDFKCEKKCQKAYTAEPYKNDHYFGKDGDVSYFENDNDAAIEELVKNGPIVAAFDVFEDFYQYKSGIYQYQAGDFVGGHAVRIVGYGEENGVKYWKVANSWDWYWGEEGYFRIRRGTDECGFESEITSGNADVDRSLKGK
jgi:cathepsin B